MANRITSPFPWISTRLYLSVANLYPSKVCWAREENVKPEPFRNAMKPIPRFVLLVRNRGPPVGAADLRALEDSVKAAFGNRTCHPNLLGVWTIDVAIYARDLILLPEFTVADSPSARLSVQSRHNVRLRTDHQVFRFFVRDSLSN